MEGFEAREGQVSNLAFRTFSLSQNLQTTELTEDLVIDSGLEVRNGGGVNTLQGLEEDPCGESDLLRPFLSCPNQNPTSGCFLPPFFLPHLLRLLGK